MARLASVISMSLFVLWFILLSGFGRAGDLGDSVSDKVLEDPIRKDLALILSDKLSIQEYNRKFSEIYRAYLRLEKYIDDIETSIENNDKQQDDLENRRKYLAGKLSELMKRNAEMVERKLPPNVDKSKIDITTIIRPDQQSCFNWATLLLAKINDQTTIDTLIDHIDRRWICGGQINGLIFGMRTNYPAALGLARAPMRCHDLIMSRLLHFIANTEDAQKQRYCVAVLYARSGGTKKEAVEKLKNAADGEKDPAKKGRLRKQIEILEKEAPEKYVLQEGGGTTD